MATLTVGAGQQYATIADAVAATQDGDTVLVQAGTYQNDFFTITHKITLQSVGGMATLVATVAPPNGKAIVTVDTDATIDGFGFTGASVSDGNGAGIRYEGGNLVVRNSAFWNNQDGLLGASVADGTIVIQNSEFGFNGAGDGYTHNLYVGAIASLTVENSYFHDAIVGHEIKSRALNTTIINNRIEDNNGDGSYSIDLPNGGNAVIEGNTIEKGVNAQNYTTIHFGGEGSPYAGSNLLVDGNTIVNDNPNGRLLVNETGAPATLSNNALYNYGSTSIAAGTATQSGNTTLMTRPDLTTSTVIPISTPVAAPATVAVAAATSLVTFGTDGAVIATGHTLTVGAHGQFATLAEALLASVDGDTIQVAAGTYVNDFGVVTHKVIIEGVGGIARFVQQNTFDAGQGILIVNADATLKNLEFTGAHNSTGHEAGVQVVGGNVTIVNTLIDGNDIGISTANDPSISLSLYNSEVGPNGNPDKGTSNLTIGAIGSLTVKGSYIHGATTGHELSSLAYFNDIENNRIIDGAGVGASFLINLGQGGNAIIAGNVLDKGPNASNSVLVHVGNEGPTYDGTDVQITGNTLISDYVNNDHPYTYFIVADDGGGYVALPSITATGNTFIGGNPGSAALVNATGSNNASISRPAGTTPLDASSPVSAALAPPMFAPVSGPNTLTLTVSEAKGAVDAQFVVAIDGVTIGGGLVTADHASMPSQAMTFSGFWGAGPHSLTITATNVSNQGAPGASMLFIDGISLDGSTAPGAVLDMYSPSLSTTVTGTTILPDFDAAYYLAHNPDVKAAGIDPLQHYLTYGWKEGRDPNALFDTKYYLAQNPDVAASGVNPLVQYEQVGWTQGRDPSPLFSLSQYEAAHPEVVAAHIDPLQQYLQSGQAAGNAIYAVAAPPVTATPAPVVQAPAVAVDPLAGSAYFNADYYLMANPDVAAAHVDPLMHFETYGWKEGRDPSAYFSIKAYDAANPSAASSGIDPLVTYLQSGQAPASPIQSPYASPEAKLFDPTYYLAHNPDVAAAHVDPLLHYEIYGWKEGRDPSAAFSTLKYLAANPDVKAAGVDPLGHYANYGIFEHRAEYGVTPSPTAG